MCLTWRGTLPYARTESTLGERREYLFPSSYSYLSTIMHASLGHYCLFSGACGRGITFFPSSSRSCAATAHCPLHAFHPLFFLQQVDAVLGVLVHPCSFPLIPRSFSDASCSLAGQAEGPPAGSVVDCAFKFQASVVD